jgi:hypothetical protein
MFFGAAIVGFVVASLFLNFLAQSPAPEEVAVKPKPQLPQR